MNQGKLKEFPSVIPKTVVSKAVSGHTNRVNQKKLGLSSFFSLKLEISKNSFFKRMDSMSFSLCKFQDCWRNFAVTEKILIERHKTSYFKMFTGQGKEIVVLNTVPCIACYIEVIQFSSTCGVDLYLLAFIFQQLLFFSYYLT